MQMVCEACKPVAQVACYLGIGAGVLVSGSCEDEVQRGEAEGLMRDECAELSGCANAALIW